MCAHRVTLQSEAVTSAVKAVVFRSLFLRVFAFLQATERTRTIVRKKVKNTGEKDDVLKIERVRGTDSIEYPFCWGSDGRCDKRRVINDTFRVAERRRSCESGRANARKFVFKWNVQKFITVFVCGPKLAVRTSDLVQSRSSRAGHMRPRPARDGFLQI